jgi:hypothetical protein
MLYFFPEPNGLYNFDVSLFLVFFFFSFSLFFLSSLTLCSECISKAFFPLNLTVCLVRAAAFFVFFFFFFVCFALRLLSTLSHRCGCVLTALSQWHVSTVWVLLNFPALFGV